MAATLTGDSVVVAVREILQSDGFGLHQMFVEPNKTNGLTFTYKTPERLVPGTYDRVAGSSDADFAVIGQVDITADTKEWFKYEITETDFATQEMADAEKAVVANSIVQGMMAQMDAELLALLETSVETGYAGLTASTSSETRSEAKVALGDIIAANESIIDSSTLGVSATRQIVILSPVAFWRYINSFSSAVLEQSNEIKVGNLTIRMINGAVIVKHPLIGKAHAAGLLHKTKAYDFSGSEGYVVTDIAAAIPVSFESVKTKEVNDWGNPEIIARYVFGKGLVRPGLVRKLLIAQP